eukprot:RCo050838
MGVSESAFTKSAVAELQRRTNLTVDQISQLQSVYLQMSGGKKRKSLTLKKMLKGCVEAGMSEAEMDSLRALFPALDLNKDGRVSFGEYVEALALLSEQGHLGAKTELAFSMFDKNGDRRIAKQEMAIALKYLNFELDLEEFYYCGSESVSSGSQQEDNLSVPKIAPLARTEFTLLEQKDFDIQIDSWVEELYAEFAVNGSSYLSLEEFTEAAERHPFLLTLSSRLLLEGPGSFLLGGHLGTCSPISSAHHSLMSSGSDFLFSSVSGWLYSSHRL